MRCYICSLEGADHEAVAVCSICGMGLCIEHAHREKMESYVGDRKIKLQRFVCSECKNGLAAE